MTGNTIETKEDLAEVYQLNADFAQEPAQREVLLSLAQAVLAQDLPLIDSLETKAYFAGACLYFIGSEV